MSRSLPKIEPGLLDLSGDSLQALLLTFFAKLRVKGDNEPLTIEELEDLTKESKERIIGALEGLSGIVGYPSNPLGLVKWEDVGRFHISKLTFVMVATPEAMEDKNGQKKMNFDTVPEASLPREVKMTEEVQKGAVIYRIKVVEDKEITFTISAKDVGTKKWITKVKDQPAATVVDAFTWWDEWLKTYDPAAVVDATDANIEAIIEWAKSLKAVDGAVPLMEGTYRTVLQAFSDSPSVGMSRIIIGETSVIEFECLGRTYRLEPLTGISIQDMMPAEDKPEETFTAEFTLGDGTHVIATANPKGRGLYTVTFVGKITESGFKTKDVRKKLFEKDGFDKWALESAEIARKSFSKGQVGA